MAQKIRTCFLGKCLAIFLALQTISCGTLFYPERRGQPPGPLDVGVVALDAVGLLLFFVPGIIAFAVDFATGAIYLPPPQAYIFTAADCRTWQSCRVNPVDLTPERLEEIVRERTGQVVHLEPGAYQAKHINKIEDITPAALADFKDAAPSRVIFRASSQ
jgi:hypothetical protein